MRLLIYDVETAQPSNIGSICSIGWVLIENDVIVNQGYSLIDPKCRFNKVNISIHGITSDEVAGSPCFRDYWNNTLYDLMTSSIVVAHSAGFDMSATQQALYNNGITDPGIYYFDTLKLFRHFLDVKSYKLPDLAALYGIEYNAHNALSDTLALADVLFHVREQMKFSDLATMFICSPVRCDNTLNDAYIPKPVKPDSFEKKARFAESVEVTGSCFKDAKVCITGDLDGYMRSDLERMIIANGGKTVTGVSSRTDYLLCCDRLDKPYDLCTTKHRAALDIIDAGGKIRIISPDTFFAMINGDK